MAKAFKPVRNLLKEKTSKVRKGISITKKSNKTLPEHSFITICKLFERPHLDYVDVIYDQPNNESFTQKIEEIQNNATLAITGLIKGTSKHQTSILVHQLF